MGICASCLGGSRHSEDAESSRLLYEDPYQNYGAFQNQQTTHGAYQPDPEDLKREQEALDAICQRTSDAVIDIWSVQPHQPSSLEPYPPSTITSNIQGGYPRLAQPHSKQSLRAKRFAEAAKSQAADYFDDLEVELSFKK